MEPNTSVGNLLPVVISENAIREIKRLMENSDKSKSLRIGVKSGGCAGFSYVLEFDEKLEEDKLYSVSEDLSVIIHPNHLSYLQGSEIDFEMGLNNRGFTFNNPNADTTCGCGTSFS